MQDKTGQSYENLTQAIFQSILDQKEVSNITVERDVTLQGKTTTHQIDIYWKFQKGLVQYETIVQAKDWSKPVDKAHLLLFREILNDLPNQPRGIFVTRSGYQEGAKEVALAHGILLYELREADNLQSLAMTTTSWAIYKAVRMPLHGLVTTGEPNPENIIALGFEVDLFTPEFSDVNFGVSTSWLNHEYPTVDAETRGQILPLPALHEMQLYDSEGTVVSSLGILFREMAQVIQKEGLEQRRSTHTFEQPTFIRVAAPLLPYLRVNDVSVTVKIDHKHEIRRGKMSNFAQWMLHELNSERKLYFAVTPAV
jgi:hypothetical protein